MQFVDGLLYGTQRAHYRKQNTQIRMMMMGLWQLIATGCFSRNLSKIAKSSAWIGICVVYYVLGGIVTQFLDRDIYYFVQFRSKPILKNNESTQTIFVYILIKKNFDNVDTLVYRKVT